MVTPLHQTHSSISQPLNSSSNRPLVSVVMPVYNGAAYLAETIKSVLNQTLTNFEFIIVDDGSRDNSWEILLAYAAQDSRIVLHHNEKNLGASPTSNKALSLARGEFIARHDQDDLSLPDRLAAQVAYFQDHPEVGLLGTAYYRLNSQGQRRLRQPPQDHTSIRWRLLFNCVYCHSSVMVRRHLFETGELVYKELPGTQDYELWIRLAKCTQATTLPTPLVIYRELEHSMTSIFEGKLGRSVMAISSQEIGALLPECSFTANEITALRRCHSPHHLSWEELGMGRVMFDLFQAFEQQPDIDPQVVRELRRHWFKRMLAATPANQWPALWTSGFLQAAFQQEPLMALRASLVHLPKNGLRQVMRHSLRKTAEGRVSS